MNLLELMEKEAKAMGVNEKLFGRNLTLKGYDDSGKTAFNYAKDKSGVSITPLNSPIISG